MSGDKSIPIGNPLKDLGKNEALKKTYMHYPDPGTSTRVPPQTSLEAQNAGLIQEYRFCCKNFFFFNFFGTL